MADAGTLGDKLTLDEVVTAELAERETLGLAAFDGVSAVLAPKLREALIVMEDDAGTLDDPLMPGEAAAEKLTAGVMLGLGAIEGVSAVLAP